MKKIRDLGSLPAEAFEKYKKSHVKQVCRQRTLSLPVDFYGYPNFLSLSVIHISYEVFPFKRIASCFYSF